MSIELAPRDTTNFHAPDDLGPDVDGLEVAGDDLPKEEGGHRGHQRQSPAARGLTSENVARFNQRTQQQQQVRASLIC